MNARENFTGDQWKAAAHLMRENGADEMHVRNALAGSSMALQLMLAIAYLYGWNDARETDVRNAA
jgi:hypothetical protein